MGVPSGSCELHDMTGCAICHPQPTGYRRGEVPIDVPRGHYVEISPGTGTYHHPDCYMATADWDGAGRATLGKRIARSPEQLLELGLRPAQCCEPPLFSGGR